MQFVWTAINDLNTVTCNIYTKVIGTNIWEQKQILYLLKCSYISDTPPFHVQLKLLLVPVTLFQKHMLQQ